MIRACRVIKRAENLHCTFIFIYTESAICFPALPTSFHSINLLVYYPSARIYGQQVTKPKGDAERDKKKRKENNAIGRSKEGRGHLLPTRTSARTAFVQKAVDR